MSEAIFYPGSDDVVAMFLGTEDALLDFEEDIVVSVGISNFVVYHSHEPERAEAAAERAEEAADRAETSEANASDRKSVV